jgi:hypothetical protein
MVNGQIRRFEAWQARAKPHVAFLTEQFITSVVPLFVDAGFQRFADYAGNDTYAVGSNCLPLQCRDGESWPTIECQFDRGGAPSVGIYLSRLPKDCFRFKNGEYYSIPRNLANVREGGECYMLCKDGLGQGAGQFGYRFFSFWPRRKLVSEVEAVVRLIPKVLDFFDEKLDRPRQNDAGGIVNQNFFRLPEPIKPSKVQTRLTP